MFRRILLAGLCAFLVFSSNYTYGRSIERPVPPEEALHTRGLATDADSLIRYLRDGIPPAHVPPPSDRPHTPPFIMERFSTYNAIVTVLGKSRRTDAVPLLKDLQFGHLSPVLQADLDIAAASNEGWSSEKPCTWDDWSRRSQWEHDRLRIACALAIAEITAESPNPFLEELVTQWTPVVAEENKKGQLESDLLRFQIGLCKLLTAQGSKAGIDAVIIVLGQRGRVDESPSVSVLKAWTGQNFGPEYDDSESTKTAEVQKWNEWWATHRDTYNADKKNMEALVPKFTPYAPPQTLRDRLWHAEKSTMDYDGQYMGKQSIAWLEENGARNTRELREIVENENENLSVRAEALKWYVKFAPTNAYPLALECLNRSSNLRYDPLSSGALQLIRDVFPAKFQEALESAITHHSSAAEYAIRDINKTPKTLALIEEAFPALNQEAQAEAIRAFLGIEPPAIWAVEAALLQPNVFRVPPGAKMVMKYGLEPKLSVEARAALDRWRADPVFVLECSEFNTEKSATLHQFETVLDAIHGDSPQHAFAYMRAHNRLHDIRKYAPALQTDPAGTDRVEKGFLHRYLQCVQAYRTNQGRPDPLPAYSLN